MAIYNGCVSVKENNFVTSGQKDCLPIFLLSRHVTFS